MEQFMKKKAQSFFFAAAQYCGRKIGYGLLANP